MKKEQLGLFIGTGLVGFVIYSSVFLHSQNSAVYLNVHALLLVILGTAGISFVIYPMAKIWDLAEFLLFSAYMPSKKNSRVDVAKDLLAGVYQRKISSTNHQHEVKTPFVLDALGLLDDNKFTTEQCLELLEGRKNAIVERYFEDARVLIVISKFPPALGLLGASTGMIEMMQGVGSNGIGSIGQSMAMALVATFWGIAIANFLILPLSDLATRKAEEQEKNRDLVIEVIRLVKEGVTVRYLFDYLAYQMTIVDRNRFVREVELLGIPNLYTSQSEQKVFEPKAFEPQNIAIDKSAYSPSKLSLMQRDPDATYVIGNDLPESEPVEKQNPVITYPKSRAK